jgi:ABC-type polar amino acid transport system ATPase subunit
MKLLEINHCNKKFGDNEVLKDISLSVEEGQVVSIIGPSGSGKSTLLRCATLLETMDGGDLIYLGEYTAKADKTGKSVYGTKADLQKARQHFGLVFQNFNLFPHYSVLKNITEPDPHRQTPQRRGLRRSKRTAAENGSGGQRRCLPLPAFRRSAAACIHCPRAGNETKNPVLRRTYFRP